MQGIEHNAEEEGEEMDDNLKFKLGVGVRLRFRREIR